MELPDTASRRTARRAYARLLAVSLITAAVLLCPVDATATPQQPDGGSRVEPAQSPASAAPAAPDYTASDSWAYWSYCADGKAKSADLFIVAPTVSLGKDGSSNMDASDPDDRASFTGALNMELGIYSGTCRVFAPYYRQATLAMYEASASEFQRAIELAYSDVCAAFERYLAQNPDSPIVLAGFSQGSDLIVRLMKDYFDDPRLQKRLVGAYAIGWRLTEDDCKECPWLVPAQSEEDTGVIVTFNSEDPAVTDSIIVPAGTTTLSINPLTWSTSTDAAPASLNEGACFTDYSGTIERETPELCGAYIDPERGTLKVTGIDPADYPSGLDIFDEGVYHLYDYQFFYRNLQQNVDVRVNAYLAAQE